MPGRVPLPQPLQGWSVHSEVPPGLSLPLLAEKGALLHSGSNFKLPGEDSPAGPVAQGLAWSLPPHLRCEDSRGDGDTGHLAWPTAPQP